MIEELEPVLAACRFLVLALALSVSLAAPTEAATTTGSLAVRVVVQPSCTVTGATLDFGTYTSGQAADLNATAQIGYANCSAGTLRFDLNGGANGTVTARRASDGVGGFLNYSLFRDSARTQNFGETTTGHTVTLTSAGAGNVMVYGRVPKSQTVAAGTYTDIVVITLNF
jgi:spore coat protein U-like protein